MSLVRILHEFHKTCEQSYRPENGGLDEVLRSLSNHNGWNFPDWRIIEDVNTRRQVQVQVQVHLFTLIQLQYNNKGKKWRSKKQS